MKLNELSKEQKNELKESWLCHHDGKDHDISWGELAVADVLVSDEDLEREYGGTDFVNDDFNCTAGRN